jgi:hypothetical protein
MIHVIPETQNGFKAEFLKVMSSLYDVGLAQLKQRYVVLNTVDEKLF